MLSLTRTPADLAAPSPPTPALDLAIAAWLAAKSGRSGSAKTQRAYSDTLAAFRGALHAAGLELDGSPAAVALVAQAWAAQGAPAPATHNQRLAILSSFYKFGQQRGMLAGENPIARVDRRPVQRYATVRALPLVEVRERLAAIDRATLEGQRDYTLLAVGLQTGRRVAELAGMRWGHLAIAGAQITVTFPRCKGGKVMHDTLPAGISKMLAEYLRAVYAEGLRGLAKDAPIWVSFSPRNAGAAIGTQAIRGLCEKHLGTTKVHTLRHTFARTMEETGAKLSEIQARLGHANAATTGVYVAALRSNENPHADALAQLLGLG
jgi:integrase